MKLGITPCGGRAAGIWDSGIPGGSCEAITADQEAIVKDDSEVSGRSTTVVVKDPCGQLEYQSSIYSLRKHD